MSSCRLLFMSAVDDLRPRLFLLRVDKPDESESSDRLRNDILRVSCDASGPCLWWVKVSITVNNRSTVSTEISPDPSEWAIGHVTWCSKCGPCDLPLNRPMWPLGSTTIHLLHSPLFSGRFSFDFVISRYTNHSPDHPIWDEAEEHHHADEGGPQDAPSLSPNADLSASSRSPEVAADTSRVTWTRAKS